MNITETLRFAISRDPRSARRLGLDAGVDPLSVKRFADGKAGLITRSADRLADHFGLELVLKNGPVATA